MTDPYERWVDLVFQGGGVKGVGLVGALEVLEARGFRVQSVAGTSAGAITAALVAAGYSSAELREIVLGLDFRAFEDPSWEDRIPLVGPELSILREQGLYKGDAFLAWIEGLLSARGVRTFADLVDPRHLDDPDRRHRLRVIASDVTAHRLLVLPRDAAHLGIEPDALSVALAVRMSMSIPIFFEPVRVTDATTGDEHLVVDGGLLSNFPVWLFDRRDGPPRWPTFGLLLVEPDPRAPIGGAALGQTRRQAHGTSTFAYLRGLVQTMLEAHDRLYVEGAEFARTIPIPTLGVGTTEFDLSPERKEALYGSGRDAATVFLKTWDFDAYVARFRGAAAVPGRREQLVAALADEGGPPPSGVPASARRSQT